jgi:2-dehydro-3-deoxyphosphogluconate aldolase / (4S)-4-hydroxy-2-oxoglutarate aldolase
MIEAVAIGMPRGARLMVRSVHQTVALPFILLFSSRCIGDTEHRQAGYMKRQEVRARIEEIGIIPGVRVSAMHLALFAAESVNEAGIPVSEITMTVPGAVDVISQLAGKYPDFVVGAGTVLDTETAKRCLDSGARFLTSPGLIPEVVEFALKNDVVVIPGALTPSEVIAAWKAGVDFVKIFPCAPVGGSKYVRALKVPLPQVRMIASGGVNQVTAAGFIQAGASALGIGSELLPAEALQMHQKKWIHELARRFMTIVRDSRAQMNVSVG